jgi:S-formylglutathione hydrolase FrmB
MGPDAGTKAQTIARLFGGSTEAWAAFDPATVISRHGRYDGVSGWFAVSSDNAPKRYHSLSVADAGAIGLGGQDNIRYSDDQTAAAERLCKLGRANGIDCSIVAQPGKHDWPFASRVFAAALPWLAGELDTPEVPLIALPSTTPLPKPASAPRTESVGR